MNHLDRKKEGKKTVETRLTQKKFHCQHARRWKLNGFLLNLYFPTGQFFLFMTVRCSCWSSVLNIIFFQHIYYWRSNVSPKRPVRILQLHCLVFMIVCSTTKKCTLSPDWSHKHGVKGPDGGAEIGGRWCHLTKKSHSPLLKSFFIGGCFLLRVTLNGTQVF